MWGRPEILWGLVALAIPIALHLLQLRRFRRVAFSNVSFLKDVQKETQSRHRLRNLLILLARLLAFACLIVAFADPMLVPEDASDVSARQSVSVYLDTSPSMMASGEVGSLLQEAKQKASALVEAFDETAQFHVFASDFDGQDQRFVTQTEALERIAGAAPSSSSPSLASVIQRAEDQLQRAASSRAQAFWVTDLQRSSHDVNQTTAPDTSARWHVLPLRANEVPNMWVDSLWFDAPIALADQPAALYVRIAHDANEGVGALPLTLQIDGVTEAIGSFNVVPGLPTDTVLRFTHGAPGNHAVQVKLSDAPVQFDDAYHLGYRVEPSVDVFHWSERHDGIHRTSSLVDQAFASASPLLSVTRASSLPSTQNLVGFDVLVANGIQRPSAGECAQIARFREAGGTVLLIPDSSGLGMSPLLEAMNMGETQGWVLGEGQVASVQWSHPLFQGVFRNVPQNVDWPTYDRLLRRRPRNDESVLATADNGMPFLSKLDGGTERGETFVLHAPLETGNFTRHGLFVPTLLRIAESSRATQSAQLTLGSDQTLLLPLRLDTLQSRASSIDWSIQALAPGQTDKQWVPEVRTTPGGTKLGWGNSLEEPGLYAVNQDGNTVAVFGLNHDRKESDLTCWTADEWTTAVGRQGWPDIEVWSQPAEGVAALVQQNIAGRRLAWYFVMGALLALALETLFLRKWNTLFS